MRKDLCNLCFRKKKKATYRAVFRCSGRVVKTIRLCDACHTFGGLAKFYSTAPWEMERI